MTTSVVLPTDAANRFAARDSSKSTLHVEAIVACDLVGETAAIWEAIRKISSVSATPFFSPRFVQVVGQLRPASQIAVISRDSQVIGFLPYEQTSGRLIEPIGKAFNDAHGMLCAPDASIDYCDVLMALNIKAYRFHAMSGLGTYSPSAKFTSQPSFTANLKAHPEGYVAYLEATRDTIAKQKRKTRKLERDFGKLRLEIDCRDEAMLQRTI